MVGRLLRPALAGAACFMGFAGAGYAGVAAAPPPVAIKTTMKALAGLEKGEWEVRRRGTRPTEAPVRRLCLGDPMQLARIRQGDDQCDSFVIADAPERGAIAYQCQVSGSGRADLRVETPRLVQISAQGVIDGAPFSETLEARRIGPCR